MIFGRCNCVVYVLRGLQEQKLEEKDNSGISSCFGVRYIDVHKRLWLRNVWVLESKRTLHSLSAKPIEEGSFKVLLIAKFASDVALNVFFLILLTFCKTDAVCIKLVVVVFAFTSSINFYFSCVRSTFFDSIAPWLFLYRYSSCIIFI